MIKTIQLLLLIFGFSIVVKAEEIRLNKNEVYFLGEGLNYLQDVHEEHTYESILNNLKEFKVSEQELFVDRASVGKYWFYFSIKNELNEEVWIDVSNAILTYIELYRFDENFVLIDSVIGGSMRSDELRATNGFTFVERIASADENETLNILIAVKTNINFEVPIFIGTLPKIMSNREAYDYFSVFTIGAFLVFFLYNFFIYLSTKSSVYLSYSVYLIAAVLVGTYLNHYPVIEYFLGPNISYNYLDIWLWSLFASAGIFTINYFDLKNADATFYYFIIVFIFIFLAFGVLNVIVPLPYIANIFQVFAVLYFIGCLFFAYRLLLRGEKKARLYCFGWSFLITGALAYVASYNGFLPYNAYTRNLSYFGYLMEAMIFSHALGQRLTGLQKQGQILNTSLHRKNEQLTALNESLDAFNYHVNHDLKTVLNNTLAMTKMIRKYNELGDSGKVKDIINRLESVAENGASTVKSFLSIGSINYLQNKENQVKLDVKEELNSIVKLNSLENQISVNIICDELTHFKIHPKAFESIFLNLFTNTIKYSNQSPSATVTFSEIEDNVKIIYRDNGRGINMEKYGHKIFRPFERGDASGDEEGTGVGLYVLNRIVLNYNGIVQLNSAPGKGIEMIIQIPTT